MRFNVRTIIISCMLYISFISTHGFACTQEVPVTISSDIHKITTDNLLHGSNWGNCKQKSPINMPGGTGKIYICTANINLGILSYTNVKKHIKKGKCRINSAGPIKVKNVSGSGYNLSIADRQNTGLPSIQIK